MLTNDQMARVVVCVWDGASWDSDRATATPDMRLEGDLALDEIDVVEIAMQLCDEFDIDMIDEKIEKAQTLGDIFELVERELCR